MPVRLEGVCQASVALAPLLASDISAEHRFTHLVVVGVQLAAASIARDARIRKSAIELRLDIGVVGSGRADRDRRSSG